jgi:hypothetical protein
VRGYGVSGIRGYGDLGNTEFTEFTEFAVGFCLLTTVSFVWFGVTRAFLKYNWRDY